MKKQKIKKLISFDFDDTLFHTPLPEEGKKIWKQKTGKDWPHRRGWWSKPESLDTEIFDIPINLNIYEKYKRAVSDPSNYVILATGRIKPLEVEVFNILDTYNFNFDEIHLNPGIDTYEFKSNLFEKLINELQPEEFIMYDDRKEHLIRFVEWAKNMPCKVTLIDAISGKEFKNKEDKNLQEQIRKVLMEEFPQEDYSNEIIKNVAMVDSVIRTLYPNFNKDDVYMERRFPIGWSIPLDCYFDIETNLKYASIHKKKRELILNKEIYGTLENYLNEDVATYVIDWFNNEFDTNAEYVTF